MKLFHRSQGEGRPLIILHGLFGSSDNWQSIAKKLSDSFRVITVDLRNHGRSFHHPDFNYDVMARDIEDLYDSLGLTEASIVGHSLGGKTAMKFALNKPDLVNALIVVDIAPKYYPIHHDKIIDALCDLEVEESSGRDELDSKLSESIPNPLIRQFLLKNLERDEDNRLKWRINLPVIKKNLERVGEEIESSRPYEGPALFIAGALSNYINKQDEPEIKKLFPKAIITHFKEAGHWIHADVPDQFIKALTTFLK